ncbi:EAL domain-containing protein [Pseudomonas sp. AM4(2022)]|uniref:EAL domain-containing protein n=1 Tax=Pseudomonas sp. AM4(2022) TaxID=2983408 RepID=UPI002E80F903|nr:EAL domain-containing protein [Pseudomonas sp. AM4(2022)]
MKNLSVRNLDLLDRARLPTAEEDRNPSSNPLAAAPPAITPYEIFRGPRNHEFASDYQPKSSLKNGTFTGAQVLVCWNHPQRGVLNPAQFLPAMQHHDLINELFFEIFEQGILLSRTLSAFGLSMELDLTCILHNLAARYFPRRSTIGLNKFQCPASRITFEVTETSSTHLSTISLKNLLRPMPERQFISYCLQYNAQPRRASLCA